MKMSLVHVPIPLFEEMSDAKVKRCGCDSCLYTNTLDTNSGRLSGSLE